MRNRNRGALRAPRKRKICSAPGSPPRPSSRRQRFRKQARRVVTRSSALRCASGRRGPWDFYRGDIGREIAADLERIGSPVTRADLETYRPVAARAFVAQPAGPHALQFAPPPTVSVAALATLGMFERLGVKEAESFTHIHGLVEATKRALSIRGRLCVDFDHCKEDAASYLTPQALEKDDVGHRHAARRALAVAARRWRHDLDGRDRRLRASRSLYPVPVLGIRIGLRAAIDRHAAAESRRLLLARSRKIPTRSRRAGSRCIR